MIRKPGFSRTRRSRQYVAVEVGIQPASVGTSGYSISGLVFKPYKP